MKHKLTLDEEFYDKLGELIRSKSKKKSWGRAEEKVRQLGRVLKKMQPHKERFVALARRILKEKAEANGVKHQTNINRQ